MCLFDRAGRAVLKDYSLEDGDDFDTFVRIIRCATCDMDAYELGLDSSVAAFDYLGSVARYPHFKIEVGENTYRTYGFLIWQTVTLQGRGTRIFGAVCVVLDPQSSTSSLRVSFSRQRNHGLLLSLFSNDPWQLS